MAMARSLAHLFFLLLLVSTAPAARDLPDAATDNLDEACGETQFPDLCARSLAAYPESRTATASPRRLAELSVLAALDAGRVAATFAHDVLNGVNDDDGLFRCLDSCSGDVDEAVAHLSALSQEPTDGRFLEVKAWLSATLGSAAPYEAAVCKDAPNTDVKDAAIAKSVEFDMMLRVALDLITEASGSMSETVALPPSELGAWSPSYGAPYGSPAYGAGAPYGAPSYGDAPPYGARKPRAPAPSPFRGYGHRRPRAPAPSPFRGYGHRRPRAPAPSPFGGYGASMPHAPAPSPFGGNGARRPRPRPRPRAPSPRRPRAPAPSPSYGARLPRAPAPRRPRAPAPSPSYGARLPGVPAPAPFVAYGARRPGAPAPSFRASRPPAPSTYSSTFGTDETA